ncbi:superfamily II DNA/RNA helicase [Streptohalobacillus salinus]|uniref:Superfamily II DNA/RNA helicase n=1 Tax=Streptohalobacillus salinus TaxID=621096 RepID=A0A2V3WHC3_9BACI|nr:DEAD/DEAH box helicase [Streptohalobacillus salinus]PXW92954.1 superfamily II DNA/RNA helicase [Streptohalobacillus salinus]
MIDTFKPFIQAQWEKEGFEKLMPIQTEVFPLLRAGKDVLATSPTGSGKTLAYLLPVLDQLETDTVDLQVVMLASSHELAMQIFETVQTYKQGSDIRVQALIGGANIKRQIEKLKKKPHIVVGTPGRMMQLIDQKKLKMHKVKTIILDEADQLFVPEHDMEIARIIESTPKETQVACFSATLTEHAKQEARDFIPEAVEVTINRKDAETPVVRHSYMLTERREKNDTLRKLAHAEKVPMLAFMQDITDLTNFYEKLDYRGLNVLMLHSDVDKTKRQKAIQAFRRGELDLLLATDVASRGLDVEGLKVVVELDVPRTVDQYIHRAGRTGRLGSVGGDVISIVTARELEDLKRLTKAMDVPLYEEELIRGKRVLKK